MRTRVYHAPYGGPAEPRSTREVTVVAMPWEQESKSTYTLIREMFADGMSIHAISLSMEMSDDTVRAVLRKAGQAA